MNRELRERVWNRAGGCCEYCRMPQAFDLLPFELDHIIAEQHHGETEEFNLGVCCFACNRRKGPNIAGRDEQTGQLVPLFNPRTDLWEEHFEWHGALLVGKTPVGRTTADVLAINLPHRVDHRASLIEEGVFPLERPTPTETGE